MCTKTIVVVDESWINIHLNWYIFFCRVSLLKEMRVSFFCRQSKSRHLLDPKITSLAPEFGKLGMDNKSTFERIPLWTLSVSTIHINRNGIEEHDKATRLRTQFHMTSIWPAQSIGLFPTLEMQKLIVLLHGTKALLFTDALLVDAGIQG